MKKIRISKVARDQIIAQLSGIIPDAEKRAVEQMKKDGHHTKYPYMVGVITARIEIIIEDLIEMGE